MCLRFEGTGIHCKGVAYPGLTQPGLFFDFIHQLELG